MHFERLTSEFKKAISEAIRELKDPRISMMCSVTGADLTKDLMYSKVYVSIMDTDEKKTETLQVLNNASSAIAKQINSKIKMRRIPQLHFVIDDSLEYSAHISKLIDQVSSKATKDAVEDITADEDIDTPEE